MLNIEIRKLMPNEAPPMNLLLLADPSSKLVEAYLQRGQCYVAVSGSDVVGEYVLLPTRPETVELVNVAVDEKFQGQGIGKLLIKPETHLVFFTIESSDQMNGAVNSVDDL